MLSNHNWIQYHILIELTRHATRRYSQLRPRDVEGNLFTYHLKGLIAGKLVEKTDEGYRLTTEGLQRVGTLSLETGRTRQQPQILNAIVCRNEKGEYLWSRWRRQPNAGMVSFPHGMMHYGEALFDAAARELAEKAALRAELRYRGDVYARGEADGAIDRHMLVHVFEATNQEPLDGVRLRPDVSESFWAPLQSFKPEDFVPGFSEIAQLVEKTGDDMIFADIIVRA